MSIIKKILGAVWILLGIYAAYYLIIDQAIPKFDSGKPEDMIPAIIYTFILAPLIAGGLGCFGYYSLTGEYDSINA
jgi:hypothetical protein